MCKIYFSEHTKLIYFVIRSDKIESGICNWQMHILSLPRDAEPSRLNLGSVIGEQYDIFLQTQIRMSEVISPEDIVECVKGQPTMPDFSAMSK